MRRLSDVSVAKRFHIFLVKFLFLRSLEACFQLGGLPQHVLEHIAQLVEQKSSMMRIVQRIVIFDILINPCLHVCACDYCFACKKLLRHRTIAFSFSLDFSHVLIHAIQVGLDGFELLDHPKVWPSWA